MITHDDQKKSVSTVLDQCKANKFWGKVILDIRGGHIIEVGVHQTLKPEKILSGEDKCLPRNE